MKTLIMAISIVFLVFRLTMMSGELVEPMMEHLPERMNTTSLFVLKH